jgi:hypothetical protein
MNSKSATNSAFFATHFEIFSNNWWALLALFANFKVEFGRNGSKNEKHFYKLVLELNFALINGLGEPSC